MTAAAPRCLVALGGNALLRRGEPADARRQRSRAETAARVLAEVAAERTLVLTHGNGPQVGLLALRAAAYRKVAPYPLDLLDAESEGMIGYLLELALRNALDGAPVATLLTQVVVDADDPAFAQPSKPIGPEYERKDLTAALLAERLGATQLLLLTDVAAAERDRGTPRARPIRRTTPAELRRLPFAAGSMAPKVEAACRFVERTGGTAAIGSLDDAEAVAGGGAGTQVAVPTHAGERRA